MNKREQILEELCDDEQIIFADGFDDAIIGVVYDELIVVYSFTKAINTLLETMSEEEAIEYLHFNVMRPSGKKNPIWVMDYYN